ncbi:MAG: Transcriptional repressor NrdR [Parcubacteria group bacterium GW2011_GWA2_36_10]|nr:MAG: Transcriptional repressor NrdR [Parcubacteria group bacterium GW2011_GWA2_36_10]
MHCPACNHQETKVIDSRLSGGGFNIRRRRECLRCKMRFSTLEAIEILDLVVIKRDGRRETYNRDKIVKGLRTSLEKRSYLEEGFQKLISEIEREITKVSKGEITSKILGDIVMKKLKTFDQVAYIRYASVYRSFKDAQTFQTELNRLLKKTKAK